MEYRIAYVDDNPISKTEFLRFFSDSYPVIHFEDANQCLSAFKDHMFPVVLSKMEMKTLSGLELLERIETIAPQTSKILLTGNGLEDLSGSPFPVFSLHSFEAEHLSEIKNFIDQALIQFHRIPASDPIRQDERLFHGKNMPDVVGNSPVLVENFKFARKISILNAPVLITGETGTGKDLLARFIHFTGNRKNKPFQIVNCAAVSSELFESEFFGHKKGAYTGAVECNQGHFEIANHGTLVLDEISEIDIKHQAKLLRAIDNQEIFSVGSQKVKIIDVRIIAISNKDLIQCIERGAFRSDLYHRLNRYSVHMPALAERPEDIAPLLRFFVKQNLNSQNGQTQLRIDPEVYDFLQTVRFPGNVRGLQNLVLKILVRKNPKDREITMKDFKGIFLKSNNGESKSTSPESLKEFLLQKEKEKIVRVLSQNSFNIARAARILGISRQNLQYRIKKLKIQTRGNE
jgi:two-component system response regulator AtoC